MLRLGISLVVKVQIEDHTIKFLVSSFLEYLVRAKDAYQREPITVSWIKEYVGANDVVYDIGANVGGFSLYIGKKISEGNGIVYAFEPEASNFLALNRNVVLNSLTGKVIPYAIAFGDANRIGSFHLSSLIPGSSMHSIKSSSTSSTKPRAEHIQGAAIYSLNKFVLEPDVLFPNHIKIDVDGVEKEIVQNMDIVLSNPKLRSVMIEIDQIISQGEIESRFQDAGFNELERSTWPGKRVHNVLYVRNK